MSARASLLFLVLVGPAFGQFDLTHSSQNAPLRIHVAYSDGTCDSSTKVELMQSTNSVARGIADKNCTVEFVGVPPGFYRLVISGRGFMGIETNEVTVDSFNSEPIEVRVPVSKENQAVSQSALSTSVASLKIPKGAAKEFSKASREMDQQDWKGAEASLRRAIEIYPQYAAAYNNLGVVYARVGNREKEAEVLHQAVAMDGQYAPAYVNLARMDLAVNDFPDAENELRKASGLNSEDGVTLVLLTYADFMNHHTDDAINDCKRVHALNNVPHAFAHWTAAFALEQKKKIAEAGEELRMFVKEEPTGERADAARKELANIANFLANQK